MESDAQMITEDRIPEFETRIGTNVQAVSVPGSHMKKARWDRNGPLPDELQGEFTNIEQVKKAVDQYNARRDNADLQAQKQKQVKLLEKEERHLKKVEAENRAMKKEIAVLKKELAVMSESKKEE